MKYAPIDLHVGMMIDNVELIEDYGHGWLCKLFCCSTINFRFIKLNRLCEGKGLLCHSCVVSERNRQQKNNLIIGAIGANNRKVLAQDLTNSYRYLLECQHCGKRQWTHWRCFDSPCTVCIHRKEIPLTSGDLTFLRQDPLYKGRVICTCEYGHEESQSKKKFRNNKARCQTCLRLIYAPNRSFNRIFHRINAALAAAPKRAIPVQIFGPWQKFPYLFAMYVMMLDGWDNSILEISRINETRGYEPGNLCWETHIENCFRRLSSIKRRKRLETRTNANLQNQSL